MADEAESRRGGLTIQAANPDGDGTVPVLISHARLLAVSKRGVGHVKECAHIVPDILQNPAAVFEGLRREEDEDRWGAGWRCYCGIPECSYSQDGTEGRPYRGQVYLVFVNDEGVAYNWRWEAADPEDPSLPVNHEARFSRRLL